MEALFTIENLTALLTLTAMEIVLGIDNIIFIAILVSKLPPAIRKKARTIGIILALFFRIALLFSLTWIMGLTEPFFTIFDHPVSGRDLILLLGGLFLVAKSTSEIHQKIAYAGAPPSADDPKPVRGGFMKAVFQIMLIDIVFSLDSVITAVGMAQVLSIMVTAVILSMFVMLWASGPISNYVDRHPTIKILALSFLILIGVMLIAEGTGAHVSKGYVYFAMAFSFGVEMLNIRYRKKVGNA